MSAAAPEIARSAPRVVTEVRALQRLVESARAAGRRVALVPTMGALHAGHAALIDAASAAADLVVVSIFVNPAQFGPQEDLSRYPRPFDRDLALCARHGADVVFAPTADEMYPSGAQTFVETTQLSQSLCGASRPGHFRGVTTVVAKLFLAAKPHLAFFGEKDFQQLVVIRRMASDLGFEVEVVGVTTVREPDGLALSSRNAFLSPEMRCEARVLSRALDVAASAIATGERGRDALLACVHDEIARAPHATLDYAELRDPETLALSPARLDGAALLALAVRFPVASAAPGATVRLIDNRVIGQGGHAGEDVP